MPVTENSISLETYRGYVDLVAFNQYYYTIQEASDVCLLQSILCTCRLNKHDQGLTGLIEHLLSSLEYADSRRVCEYLHAISRRCHTTYMALPVTLRNLYASN